MSEAKKLNELSERMEELREEIKNLREKYEAIDQEALDAEEDDYWDSDVVNEIIMDLETAENAVEGII